MAKAPPSMSVCPWCNGPMPKPVYDDTTHTYDVSNMMQHLNSCGSSTIDQGLEGTWE